MEDNDCDWGSTSFADEEHGYTEDSFGSNVPRSIWPLSGTNDPGFEKPVWNDSDGTRPSSSARRQSQLLHQGPKIKKGWGPESRAKAPDPHDFYDFQRSSDAYICLRVMGYRFCTLDDIVHIGSKVEDLLLAKDRPMTERNRAARRRKPNAFHWIDENWSNIDPDMFKIAVFAVLGDPTCPRIRRRHGVKTRD
jgi:hypothetical protein